MKKYILIFFFLCGLINAQSWSYLYWGTAISKWGIGGISGAQLRVINNFPDTVSTDIRYLSLEKSDSTNARFLAKEMFVNYGDTTRLHFVAGFKDSLSRVIESIDTSVSWLVYFDPTDSTFHLNDTTFSSTLDSISVHRIWINTADDEIDALADSITQVRSSITQNYNSISLNVDSIAIHRTEINTEKGNVDALQDTISVHRTGINLNATDIDINAASITGINDSLTTLESNINVNATGISLVSSRITTDSTNVRDSIVAFINVRPDTIGIGAATVKIDGDIILDGTVTAQEIDVTDLFAQTIELTGSIATTNYVAGTTGWKIYPNGYADFDSISIRAKNGSVIDWQYLTNIDVDSINATKGTIGGFSLASGNITSTNMGLISGANAQILLGHATDYASAAIGFKNDGTGKLANGNIFWNAVGSVTITDGILSAPVITGGELNAVNIQSGTLSTGNGYADYIDIETNGVTFTELSSSLSSTIAGSGGSMMFTTDNVNTGFHFNRYVNATNGYRVNSSATSGEYLRGNGTNFVSSALLTSDLSGQVSIANGGTGASTASAARTNLGLVISSDVQAYDFDLTTIGGLTKTDGNFIVANGSAWTVESGATVRTSLGLGSLATLSSVNDGNWSGTDLAIANGGTGASTASGARSNLGLGEMALAETSLDLLSGSAPTGGNNGDVVYDDDTGKIWIKISGTWRQIQ